MKYSLALLLLSGNFLCAQVYQTDTNEINDILKGEIQNIEKMRHEEEVQQQRIRKAAARKKKKQKEKEEADKKKQEALATPQEITKKYTVLYDKLAEVQVGRLTLPDGSRWIVQSEDVAKTLLWKVNQKLHVRLEKEVDPVNGFTTEFTNLDNNSKIHVMMEILPLVASPISRFLQKDPKRVVQDMHAIALNIRSGSIIELHNGTKFNIAPLDMIITRYWKPNQSLKLHHKKEGVHPFQLYNESTHEKVSANLIKPPNPPYKLKFHSLIFTDEKYEEELDASKKVDGYYMGSEEDQDN